MNGYGGTINAPITFFLFVKMYKYLMSDLTILVFMNSMIRVIDYDCYKDTFLLDPITKIVS